MPKRHYTIYCDESAKVGAYFSNFYAGALIRSRDREAIESLLRAKKDELNLFRELKWTRITENYLEKYLEFIDLYFDLVETRRIKVRIMFTHNIFQATSLTKKQLDNEYFILYYHLIKHGFGLRYCNPNGIDRIYISLLLDELPHNKEKCDRFKKRISGLSYLRLFESARVTIAKEDITDVSSSNHTIMQGLDIILGAMQFRLNDKHKHKAPGSRRRGKRTIAKEFVYRHINKRIRDIYPNFNIGNSTGRPNGAIDAWNHSYRHWKFIASEHEVDDSYAKMR